MGGPAAIGYPRTARRAAFGAYSSVWLERFPDKEEVGGSSPPRPTLLAPPAGARRTREVPLKKLLVLAAAVAAGFVVYQKLQADKAEQDLWTEATQETLDLR